LHTSVAINVFGNILKINGIAIIGDLGKQISELKLLNYEINKKLNTVYLIS